MAAQNVRSRRQILVAFMFLVPILTLLNFYGGFLPNGDLSLDLLSLLDEVPVLNASASNDLPSALSPFSVVPDEQTPESAEKMMTSSARNSCEINLVILAIPKRMAYAIRHSQILLSQGLNRDCLFIAVHQADTTVENTLFDIEFLAVDCPLPKQSILSNFRGQKRDEAEMDITHAYVCVMESFFERLSGSDPKHTYVSFLEDDLQPSPDFVASMLWARRIMELDNTIGAASAWNDNYQNIQPNHDIARQWYGLDPSLWFLTDQFVGSGFMMRLETLRDIHEAISRTPSKAWDATASKYFLVQHLSTIFPEIPRTYHVPSSSEGAELKLLSMPFQLQSPVTYAPPELYTTDGYEQWVERLIVDYCTNNNELGAIGKLVYYPLITNAIFTQGWNTVGRDFQHLRGVQVSGRMRMEWRGTLFASATSNPPVRSLIVAAFSPYAQVLQSSCELGERVQREKHFIQSRSSGIGL